MNLIITMAGKYMRFKEAGYTTPKFLLPIKNNQTIFQEIMEQLVTGYDFENIIFVANKADSDHREIIEKAIKASGIESYDLLFIGDTKGQAETALYGVNALEKKQCHSQKIVIHNIDTILYDRDMKQIASQLDKFSGYIDVFEAREDCYSFVKTDSKGIVTEIKEKVVISNKATTGLYAFANIAEYKWYYNSLKTTGEYYISFIYESMIRDKKKIATNARMAKTVILGTPVEYEMYKNYLAK